MSWTTVEETTSLDVLEAPLLPPLAGVVFY